MNVKMRIQKQNEQKTNIIDYNRGLQNQISLLLYTSRLTRAKRQRTYVGM